MRWRFFVPGYLLAHIIRRSRLQPLGSNHRWVNLNLDHVRFRVRLGDRQLPAGKLREPLPAAELLPRQRQRCDHKPPLIIGARFVQRIADSESIAQQPEQLMRQRLRRSTVGMLEQSPPQVVGQMVSVGHRRFRPACWLGGV